MRFRSRGRLQAGLLVLSPLVLRLAGATPAIDVGLRASWNSAPFLLELLETAAIEDPASYFPLVSRIADGVFANSTSDRDLYDTFLRVASQDGFLAGPEEVASFNLALSLHAAAPRIEANYQYYETALEPIMGALYNPKADVWLQWGSKQVVADKDLQGLLLSHTRFPNDRRKLQFERVREDCEDVPAAILYADPRDPAFKEFHDILMKMAGDCRLSYRLRYRPPQERPDRPVMLSGYGVELALKKTDYMVMDDREVQSEDDKEKGDKSQAPLGRLADEETHDIKPLAQKEIATLGMKAATFIMQSEDPFVTLSKLLQDFPKHSAAVSALEIDESLKDELTENWESFAGFGENVMWINGLQMTSDQINAYALLDHLRQERKHIKALSTLGLSPSEAIQLLSHDTFLMAKREEKPQRFDYRDDLEDGLAISWMNDIEYDRKYREWSTSVNTLMRRVFPGQLHPLRKNIYNLVVPIDFSSREDLFLIYENFKNFIQRKIAIRFGLVPLTKTTAATSQAQIWHHLVGAYGLATALRWAEACVQNSKTDTVASDVAKAAFEEIQKDVKLREGRSSMPLAEVLTDVTLLNQIEAARKWVARMGAHSDPPPMFFNGQAFVRDEDWMQNMQVKLQGDVMTAQRGVYEMEIEDHTNFVEYFLDGAATRRNTHVFEDDDAIRMVDVAEIASQDYFKKFPTILTATPDPKSETTIWVVGNFDEWDGWDLLASATELQKKTLGLSLVLVHNPRTPEDKTYNPKLSAILFRLQQHGFFKTPEMLQKLVEEVNPRDSDDINVTAPLEPQHRSTYPGQDYIPDVKTAGWELPDLMEASKFWETSSKAMLKGTGVNPEERALVVNGRVVGPIPANEGFSLDDFEALLRYEHTKRIKPVLEAAEKLTVTNKLKGPLDFAALTNRIALTSVATGPPSLYDRADKPRTDIPDRMLKSEHSGIIVGDKDNALIQITASIDPASETAQKWMPILKVLTEMHGIYLKIFLNPERMINELPVKRFYRHVLEAAPRFDATGGLIDPRVRFTNVPDSPLLSLSMDVPSSWLVTPKDCIHDLDNIKLDAMKERLRGGDIKALYELRSILIEGHSRDATSGGQPPRGAQLVLGTEQHPHFADTIIMANVGYFQFKANPGFWKISLKEGRSDEIFKIDTIGNGASEIDEDTPEVALMSFQGVTLFPKLSRRDGMETEDVLEAAVDNADISDPVSLAKKWWKKADGLLHGSKPKPVQADINIFSVASGHLYERFLNIMMLSVIKNTNHTVKFWFIENFLSPSFKDFIPSMAAEYGFDYELVTYKWPHWLRGQKEKQREIWGYKILFLDVLFPLDLDKVIFVDADQIVRTDLHELVTLDLEGAPYGFTPMCDSRTEIEGFRFWKQGYWKTFLRGLPYHISALYVVDLKRFRGLAAGDRLRQQYHSLSADPQSLSNLDQDLPNHMQTVLPIHSLPQEWLWCETWCSDESLKDAKTIDLCNNPMTKEPKLDRARRQVPEWTLYDEEVAALARRKAESAGAAAGHLSEGVQAKVAEEASRESEAVAEKEAAAAATATAKKDAKEDLKETKEMTAKTDTKDVKEAKETKEAKEKVEEPAAEKSKEHDEL